MTDERERVMSVEMEDGRTMRGSVEALAALAEARRDTRERDAIWPKRADGIIDRLAAMTKLARSFPTLEGAPYVEPWDAIGFLKWTCTGGLSSGAFHAAKFVLSVWDPQTDWNEAAHAEGFISGEQRLGPFDLHGALGVWDYEHRDAFALWVTCAFWP